MWKNYFTSFFSPQVDDEALNERLTEILAAIPTPVFWLLGKTQSGKTSIIKALTGDSRAQIGNGMQPCTRTAFVYDFPNSASCMCRFLDTRGLGEVDYDPKADIEAFQEQTHVLIVVLKAMDHDQHAIIQAVRKIAKVKPDWPIIVVQTALHEGYPDHHFEHPQPYPFDLANGSEFVPPNLQKSLTAQRQWFKGIKAQFVALDFTLPEDNYPPANYGIDALWSSLEEALPHGVAAMLRNIKSLRRELQSLYSKTAEPHIFAYAIIAGLAGAIPIPAVDIPLVTLVQIKMLHTIASIYRYQLDSKSWAEISSALGITLLTNLGRRELVKFVPIYGPAVSAVLTAATTYALGKTMAVYMQNIRNGDAAGKDMFRKIYAEQFEVGRELLKDYVAGMQHKEAAS